MSWAAAQEPARSIVIDFGRELGPVETRTGFLGGLRDATPDAVIAPPHPSLWRIGHQFRGRIAQGLPGAIYRAYRYYGSTQGQTGVASEGDDDQIAALGSETRDRFEVLLGSVAKAPAAVALDLKGLPPGTLKLQVHLVPASGLATPLPAENLPLVKDYTSARGKDGVRVTLPTVHENQAYHLSWSR